MSKPNNTLFERTGATLISDTDMPNPNPKGSPFKKMAVLTWRESDGSTTITYGCRQTGAQFPTRQGLYHYVGRVINGRSGKPKKKKAKVSRTRTINSLVSKAIEKELESLVNEVEVWKSRAREAEAQLARVRAFLKS